jgi:LytS/YehU family sensor histidine kinase
LKTFKIAIIATLAAISIATNYALIGVSNVKLMDFIVFVGGFCFGPFVGISIGVLSWLIYGAINPQGFVPLVWLATMSAESIYGVVGGYLGKSLASADFRGQRLKLSVFFATMGFLPTVLYDLITNVVYASSFNVPIVVAILAGTPFTVTHEVANAAIFGICSVPIIAALGKLSRGGRYDLFRK